ncbi:MAG: hypothetical protein WD768_16820 [Phycisphaeraceae bacterium]
MTKVKTSTSKHSHPIRVGERVHVQVGPTKRTVEIVEDRGLIGVGGRRIYRVRLVDQAEDLQSTFEVPAAQVSVIPRVRQIAAGVKKYRS